MLGNNGSLAPLPNSFSSLSPPRPTYRILHLLLAILGFSPSLFSELLSILFIISDQDIVKNGASLDLGKIATIWPLVLR